MTTPRQGLERLDRAAETGGLAELCRRHGITLLVVFGSSTRADSEPRDLDLAFAGTSGSTDVLTFLDDLSALAGTSQIDLMDLKRVGPVARERALVSGRPLAEDRAGSFARAQLAAIMERMDTDWLRKMELDLMTRGR